VLGEFGSVEIQASATPVQNGLRFLLRTQLEDGTWFVRRRAFPFQPPMDSSFAHGADGWLSAAASSWAMMALTAALDPADAERALASSGNRSTGHVAATVASATRASEPVVSTRSGATTVDFVRDIRPVLERSCVACHSGERPKGGFKVVSRSAMLGGGNRGEPVVVTHHSEQSPLLRLVTDQIEDLEMPPLDKRDKFPALSQDEITRLRAWIDAGASWPDGLTIGEPPAARP
jgi:mono/diheme cytochrome c family protein